MNHRPRFYRFLQVCWGITFALLSVPSSVSAQTASDACRFCQGGLSPSWQNPNSTIHPNASEAAVGERSVTTQAFVLQAALELYPYLYVPELPPIQPTFPDSSIHSEIRLVIRLGNRRVYVYRGDELQFSYPIAIGKPGWETPTGSYEVISMLENPGWTNPFTGEIVAPGAENPLGERWIGFWTDGRNTIGFHGTPNRRSVGRAASHGCIRMYNEDVRALYEIVSLGTSVKVEP
jgi:L,D-transpeptidase ErfK/SrfK